MKDSSDFYSNTPQWSPDSKRIVFSDWRQLYLISADGGSAERLIPNPNHEVWPGWSPDRKSITFNDYPKPGEPVAIKALDLATRQISILPGSDGMYMATWAPDGKHMVAWRANPPRLILYSTESKNWKELGRFESPDVNWLWAQDSKSLYLDATEARPDHEPGVYRLAIADGAWKRVGALEGIDLIYDSSETFPSLTVDDRLVMMNGTSIVQVYLLKWV